MKTIINAVCAVRGKWMAPPSWAHEAGMFYIRYGTGLDIGNWVFCNHIPDEGCYFTRKQFDDCVKECSSNFGKPTKKENTMIKFDLERALAGDKVLTIEGAKVHQLTIFNVSSGRVLKGVVEGVLKTLTKDYLRMAPKPLSGFVNVYPNGVLSGKYITKKHADKDSLAPSRIACIDLSTHNEGEGLT